MEDGKEGTSSSPPSRANLKAWWRNFKLVNSAKRELNAKAEKTAQRQPPPGKVFGVPLRDSLRYANVPISTASGKDGMLYIYGYVPVVVAKCGLYLKETATEVEGTFRVNGSAKRMRELQAEFETPPKYGKGIVWSKSIYTSHDVASVFRRYLTQMPEPVIPVNLYHKFRDAFSQQPFVREKVVETFQKLIKLMPRSNQYLLLYVLDLLSVFARKADKNLMTATNLAVIFRPGILSHPDQELSPQHHKLSQQILEFLIEEQDRFLIEIPPPPRNDSILVPSAMAIKNGATGLGSPIPPSPDDDYFMVPSSGEEDHEPSIPRGGWKLVEDRAPTQVTLTANPNSSDVVLGEGLSKSASVKRSVTVPSRKSPRPESNKLRRPKESPDSSATGSGDVKRTGSLLRRSKGGPSPSGSGQGHAAPTLAGMR